MSLEHVMDALRGAVSRASKMLSHTDIHYIAGFLYVVSRRVDITVRIGDRIYDQTSESRRDVDIVIATVSTAGLIGVESNVESRGSRAGSRVR